MASRHPQVSERPREWRRRVSIPAKVRHGVSWSDGHILNISSRGLLLQYGRPLALGSTVELRKDEKTILATVVWREGYRTGLKFPGPIPIVDLIPPDKAGNADAGDAALAKAQRRSTQRDAEQSRELGRKLEFLVIGLFAAAMILAIGAMAASVLFKPLARVGAVLG